MKKSTGTFYGANDLELWYHTWAPPEIRGALIVVHGFGEHSRRYATLVEHLVPRSYALYAFDLRGHGRSPGHRGHVNAWAEYREDVYAFVQLVDAQLPGTPLFLLGHSMGALIALDYLLHHPEGLRGAAISGAPIEPVGVAKPHQVFLARTLSRLWPRFPLQVELELAALSRDTAMVRAYREDPQVHGRATARWGAEGLRAVERVKAGAPQITLPLLIIHGEADRINAVSGSRWLYEQVSSPDKQLRTYPGSYHEVHNDLDGEQLVEDLAQWMEAHR
jgi:alpha-beta hydrolase superfamily lysophospholipase